MRSLSSEVSGLLDKLRDERFRERMEDVYGRTYGEAVKAGCAKLAAVGFEESGARRINRMGWTLSNVKWLQDNRRLLQDVLDDGKSISERYRYVVFCGMGGSGLSVQTVKSAFGERDVRIMSLRTTDPSAIAGILGEISEEAGGLNEGLMKSLIIPISKSGTTQETVSHKLYFEKLYAKCGIDVKDHMWVLTDKGSPIDRGEYVQRDIQLNGKDDIGGRFTSPTTRIFLLPLALTAPEALEDVLSQASRMNEKASIEEDTFVVLGAFLKHLAADRGKDKLTFIVPDEFRDLPVWAEQLFEESLGKGGKGISVFYGEDLSLDSLRPSEESRRIFIRICVGGKKPQDSLWQQLTEAGYWTFDIEVDGRNSIGGLMLGFERAVATIGYLWGICFVDQPAVEGYKKATRDVIAAMPPGEGVRIPKGWFDSSASFGKLRLFFGPLIAAGTITSDEIKAQVSSMGGKMSDAPAVYAAILKVLERRRKGFEAIELASYGKMTARIRQTLEEARSRIFTNGLKMPSKLGEGPDKNHSYQQNLEDGRDSFFSTSFMYMRPEQPDAMGYDDSLLKAQTIGTVESLSKNGRKAVLLASDSTVKGAEADLKQFFEKVREFMDG
ncbi:MAG: hypothetical protein V1875_04110 [Candidatus Altiarchaeota archaeon]